MVSRPLAKGPRGTKNHCPATMEPKTLPTDPPHSPLLTGRFIQMAQGSAGGYGLPLPSMGLHLRDPKDEQISIPEIHYLFTETFWLIVGQVQAFFWTFRKKLKAKKTQANYSKTQ